MRGHNRQKRRRQTRAEPTGTEPAVQTEPAVGGDGGLGPLPAIVMGISTMVVICGLLGALLMFGVVAILWRGGSRNDSGFEL